MTITTTPPRGGAVVIRLLTRVIRPSRMAAGIATTAAAGQAGCTAAEEPLRGTQEAGRPRGVPSTEPAAQYPEAERWPECSGRPAPRPDPASPSTGCQTDAGPGRTAAALGRTAGTAPILSA